MKEASYVMRTKSSRIQAKDHAAPGTSPTVIRLAEASRTAPEPSIAGLAAAQALDLDGESNAVTLRIGTVEVPSKLHPSVDPVVIRRAIQCGELVIAQRQVTQHKPGDWLVIGVLRTSATPGLDVGDDYVIEARRVTVRAEHELVLTSGVARVALAAIGRIESIARQITSRASTVHKIIGRVIQLN